ncbi:hypothetical protein C3L33_22680, partial [Rhododendron williamsianum]
MKLRAGPSYSPRHANWSLNHQTIQVKDSLALTYAELVYAGRWFDPLRTSMDAFMKKITETTTGSVILKLYKGCVTVWDLVTGKLLQNLAFLLPITASVLDPAEKMLFSGTSDGRIFISILDVGLEEDSSTVSEEEPIVLKGHK